MARKKLTDLLREEVAKSPEFNNEITSDLGVNQDGDPVEESAMATEVIPETQSLNPKDLDKTVDELKSALAAAQQKEKVLTQLQESLAESNQKEASLQKQITDLQKDLQQQKQSVATLQKEVEKVDKIEHLKTELDQAKQAAIQLAQVNEKLSKEIDALKKENETLKGTPNRTLQPKNQQIVRPVQKSDDTPPDFAKNTWLL
ncbi:hypothetical protein [Limnofasciculus baicalensis]|uniref:Uncharacterized protein n=1 Tax=Limnofasciculus baicalensis BBK-W-15 TaxID=2699891 RepID=A0AAE3GUL2_9CYAN|nr:hypothetical protein [Limnofasciculus baicalensis]MCP2730347.1 hypothetical protein [Limnofasciculus baicalensis BBK-W-15]